jgi:two-component system, NtrC family, response regulator AtoC
MQRHYPDRLPESTPGTTHAEEQKPVIIEGGPIAIQEKPQTVEKSLIDREFIGCSRAAEQVKEKVKKVAPSASRVCICGESGTGKEIIARAIHALSLRASQPFVKFNAVAVPNDLIESELFGHVKGAFTGATQSAKGRFVLADRGSIFIDEIGEMKLAMQEKLLCVLQDREVWPVGGTKAVPIDVRVISATNRDLEWWIREGKFREDLFYRINVVEIRIPPLKERPEDIPLLVRHLLRKLRPSSAGTSVICDEGAMDLLCAYHWPGNVRQLENTIERALVWGNGQVITESDVREALPIEAILRRHTSYPLLSVDLRREKLALEREELERIEAELRRDKGKLSATAQRLGIPPSTLRSRRKRLRQRLSLAGRQ